MSSSDGALTWSTQLVAPQTRLHAIWIGDAARYVAGNAGTIWRAALP